MAITKTQGPFSQGIDDNADATAITIDSSEQVGIGTTSPTDKLHVYGGSSGGTTAHSYTQLHVEHSSHAAIQLSTPNSSESTIFFGDPQDNDIGAVGYYHAQDFVYLRANGDTRLRVDADGIKFGSDSAAANALDDYEEGTWTPAYIQGFSSVSYHATHLSGTYTKVGNQVNCWFYIYLNTSTGNGADIKLGGLPYNQRPNVSSGTVINIRSIGNSGYNTLISGKHLQFYGEPSTNYFYLYSDGSTAASVSGGSPSGTFLIGSLSYQAS